MTTSILQDFFIDVASVPEELIFVKNYFLKPDILQVLHEEIFDLIKDFPDLGY